MYFMGEQEGTHEKFAKPMEMSSIWNENFTTNCLNC